MVKPDLLASASEDRTIRLWHWHNDGPSLCTLSGHKGNINTIEVISPNVLASGSDDKTIRFWDSTSGDCLHTLAGHSGPINMLKILSDEVLGKKIVFIIPIFIVTVFQKMYNCIQYHSA